MPVVTDCAKRGETTVFEITDKSYTEHDQQGEQTKADMQSVEPSKREKCRREKIQAKISVQGTEYWISAVNEEPAK